MLSKSDFAINIENSIRDSFAQVDDQYLKLVDSTGTSQQVDRSGSCAIVCMSVDDNLYFANVGDSRAILSKSLGEKVFQCTEDHKPAADCESIRIMSHGGTIYR